MSQQSRPYSIRMFLPDGTPDGIRIIEKSNWTGVGLVVPKSRFPTAKQRHEFERTGVYVLVGADELTDRQTIYVGQGDPVRSRLDQHYAQKAFWTWAVFFVTRDDSLNKAHIGHLETALILRARDAKRCELNNQNTPQPSPLSEADAADMESFLEDMLSILPLVGLNAFERPRRDAGQVLLKMTRNGIKAAGYESSQGFVVQEGSLAFKSESPGIHSYQTDIRKLLLQDGVLVDDGDAEFYRLSQDYEFTSPSTAAAVLLGRSANGRTEWKDAEGKTLKQFQEESDRGER